MSEREPDRDDAASAHESEPSRDHDATPRRASKAREAASKVGAGAGKAEGVGKPIGAGKAARAVAAPREGRAFQWLLVGLPVAAVGVALVVTRTPPAPPEPTVRTAASSPTPPAPPGHAGLGAPHDVERPERPRRDAPIVGRVAEVIEAATYLYLRLETKSEGEVWAAVSRAPVKVGDEAVVEDAILMERFESRTLGRTFPAIWFGMLKSPSAQAPSPSVTASASPSVTASASAAASAVASAAASAAATSGPAPTELLTVAAFLTKGTTMKGQRVRVEGVVTKVNEGILERNWIHLSDGGGLDNDLLVTSTEKTEVGKKVRAEGVVGVDRDFGAGYRYPVLLEDARLETVP